MLNYLFLPFVVQLNVSDVKFLGPARFSKKIFCSDFFYIAFNVGLGKYAQSFFYVEYSIYTHILVL